MNKQSFLTGTAFALSSLVSFVQAQDTAVHPRGLFDVPQKGINAPEPRTPGDAEGWKDRTHLTLGIGARYDNNIFRTNTNEESDVIFTISPTLRFSNAERGAAENVFRFSYTPSAAIYADNSDRNSINHSVNFSFFKEMAKTQIDFTLGYTKSTGSDRFVSGLIDRDSLRSTFRVSHILTGKTRLDFDTYYNIDSFDTGGLFDDRTYGANLALLYQATGKLAIGPQFGYGMSELDGGSRDHDFYSVGLRFEYQLTGKTHLTGSVGHSSRSFSGGGSAGDFDSATWQIGASHQLSSKTDIRASIYRRANTSYNFVDSGYLATGVSISASHTVSSRLSCYATLNFENDDYFRASAAGTNLDNDYYSIVIGGRYRFSNAFTLGANLSYSENSSNNALNDFDSVSFGLNGSYVFW